MHNDDRSGNQGHTYAPTLRRDGESHTHTRTHTLESDKGHTHTLLHSKTGEEGYTDPRKVIR